MIAGDGDDNKDDLGEIGQGLVGSVVCCCFGKCFNNKKGFVC